MADAPPRRERAACATAPGGGTILLVDDEALGRMGIAVALRELGYGVMEARSGEDALDALGRMPSLDLLITDYAMLGMSRTEPVAEVRRLHPELKAIMITGHAAFSFDETSADLSAIIRKPFRMEELAQRISSILATEEPPSNVVGFDRMGRHVW